MTETTKPLAEWTMKELLDCGPHFDRHVGVWEEIVSRAKPGPAVVVRYPIKGFPNVT